MASEVTPDPFEEMSGSPQLPTHSSKKTWRELLQAVKKSRRLQTNSLVNRVPHTFTFRHVQTEAGQQTRLYFLGMPMGSRENTLLYVDLPSEDDFPTLTNLLPWKPLLDSFHATPFMGQFSKEEQLLRERKRLASFGITSYDYVPSCSKFVFPACNSLFTCTDDNLSSKALLANEVKSCCVNSRLDPKLCPSNPNLIAFVSGNDVWVTELQNNMERRLTFAHKGLKNLTDDPLSAGVPSFVVQEEFNRYTGYWWQPKTASDRENVYRILYEEVDESEVEILNIVSATNDDKGVDEYRYPRAGSANAKCSLKLLEFELDEAGTIKESIMDKHLAESLSEFFPWMEYILRAGWTPDGKYVYAQVLDRKQQRTALVLIPLQCFVPVCSDVEMTCVDEINMTSMQVIYEETSDIWVNVHDILHFFSQDSESEISFIWSSEKTGFRHLYHVTSALMPPSVGNSAMDYIEQHHDCQQANVLREVALTSGDWEVIGKQLWVDSDNKLVYFMGLRDTPMESHLYVVSYEKPGDIVRLTELGFSHGVCMDQHCSVFVSVHSSLNKPPASHVFRIDHDADGLVVQSPVGTLLEATSIGEEYAPPELFSFQSKAGHTAYGMVYKPQGVDISKPCPTVVYVYGGPQIQLVSNAYKGQRFLRLVTLATLGYAVVVLDSRGSANRGLEFESHIKNRLGTVEIEEQVEGLTWLASEVSYIDLSRVAIHGWSYGGYISLMGLCQRPDVFKIAVSGAPVTSWKLYDTGYTERYMDTPQNNQIGYQRGCVLHYIDRFPEEENRLLIVHGLIDENVHFQHTSLLVNALIKACKPYQLQVYPNERHGIRNPEASEHYETMVLSFLQQHL